MKKILFIVIIAILVSLISYCSWRNMTYSDGVRAGYLIKISKKGYFFKTMEGQLNLTGLSGGGLDDALGKNIWQFSVADDAVYQKLQQYEGKKVSLHYKQKINSFSWQGDTDYFVDEVELVQ